MGMLYHEAARSLPGGLQARVWVWGLGCRVGLRVPFSGPGGTRRQVEQGDRHLMSLRRLTALPKWKGFHHP